MIDDLFETRSKLIINTHHLAYNFDYLKRLNQHKKIICMVKANAYGHGSITVAQALDHKTDYFGTAGIDGAIKLRKAGIKSKIMVFCGFFSIDHIPLLKTYNLIPVIHSLYQLELLIKHAGQWSVELWLKLNTGMNRLGFNESDFKQALDLVNQNPHLFTQRNVLSHLAESEVQDSDFTKQQLHRMKTMIQDIHFDHISISNSAHAISAQDPFFNVIRIGIALYGIASSNQDDPAKSPLKPVMTFKARIIAIQHLDKGDYVGYNRQWQAKKSTKIAVVATGFGDGYPPIAPNNTPVMIQGVRCPLVGRVSMDMITVDVTNLATVNIGEEATLWGEALPVETVSKAINISPYALITGLRKRIQQQVI